MESPISILPPLPTLHLSLSITSNILFGVLLVFGVIYIIVSGVLFYHWTAYGMGSKGVYVGEVLFSSVSVLLFITAVLSISYF
ncbi:MAG: hypothetical protein AB201_02890 [Parcubacteria bacterium C7867-006]|nr:MAG: hypothetical protein AB201_02890 [Parcubacteria bacterium C7867-006]